ncbi:unnamed protein product [Allacma fusca]|uniref:Uncharacterized protein n=1 Tax=Allacma fusca TaxID=39272 RepID=A0A8J2LP95_9HEXA|nr:unnamed protein product [Allacma fusca]
MKHFIVICTGILIALISTTIIEADTNFFLTTTGTCWWTGCQPLEDKKKSSCGKYVVSTEVKKCNEREISRHCCRYYWG